MGNTRTICCDSGIEWLERLERFAPESIAASPNRLLLLADLRRDGILSLPSLRHSLVMQFELGESWITTEELDDLWDVFQLPVYEQICSADGELLAWECEARSGLHITEGQAWMVDRSARLWHSQPRPVYDSRPNPPVLTGLYGRIELEGCACTRPGPRLFVYGSELPWKKPQVLRKVS